MGQSATTKGSCCESRHAGDLGLRVEEAREKIRAGVRRVEGVERLYVREARGRVLAEDVTSPINVPGDDNSAMDGYALRGADLPADGRRTFRVVGRTLAGETFPDRVGEGECVRIMTGAPVPAGADTVVMQENIVEEGADAVSVGAGEEPGQHVRPAGGDIAAGEVVLPRGTRIGVPEVGVLGSLGRVEVAVYRRPKVAFFSTGDELKGAGETVGPGEIYDSNRYTLHAALERLGVDACDMGVVTDTPEALTAAFRAAGSFADAIITSGGVSVGEADHVKEVLAAEGDVGFWRVALRPGRPVAFGRVGEAVFFGLPGNPVSAACTYLQLVEPALRYMMGESDPRPPHLFEARCLSHLSKGRGRTEYQRGILGVGEDGRPEVRSTGHQGSGILTSMVRADCLIVLEHDRGPVEPGESVSVQPFAGVF